MPDLRLFVLILLCYQRAAFVAVPLNSPTQHIPHHFTVAWEIQLVAVTSQHGYGL